MKTKFFTSITTAALSVLAILAPAQALKFQSFDFSGLSYESLTARISFSYDDSLFSGILGKNQLSSFQISFLKPDGQLVQQYSSLADVFHLEFDTNTNIVNAIDAGAFSSRFWDNPSEGGDWYYDGSEDDPLGALSFSKNIPGRNEFGCDGMIFELVEDGYLSTGSCNNNPQPNPIPNNPQPNDPTSVPEPTSVIAFLLLGAGWAIKRQSGGELPAKLKVSKLF